MTALVLLATDGPRWLQWTGVWNESGPWYGFWSGFGACLTYLAVFAAVYRYFKCQSCPRPAFHHRVPGTHYRTCSKHTTAKEHSRLLARHKKKYPDHLTHTEGNAP